MNDNPSLEAMGFAPANTVFAVRDHDLCVQDGEHPWFVENRPAIEDNWAREVAANPALFNGGMVFQRRLSFRDGRIEGRAHIAPFATFLHWRKQANRDGGFHLFALPLIMSSDNALIAIRMAKTTANPGRVYCAAGSMDKSDVIDGRCDLDFNMRREVLEETGFDLDDAERDADAYGVQAFNTVTVFRRYRYAMTADEMLARIAAHVAADPEPEIDCALAIRNADPAAHDYPFFMPLVLDWLFNRKG